MDQGKSKKDNSINIRDLYPQLTESQLKEAEENLEGYLEVVLRIYERIRQDPKAYAQLKALTASRRSHTMDEKRSHPS